MPALRWGIVGAGAISHDFVVGLKTLPESEHRVVAVAARSLERAREFAAKHAISRAYGDYEELARDEEVDVAYVGTIPVAHPATASKMLEREKAVLCEKPLTMSVRETRAMFQKAREKNAFLMEAVWMRFFPAVRQLRSLIAGGAIGEVQFVRANSSFRLPAERKTSYLGDPALGGGVLYNAGVYPIQLATMIFNERPEKISAQGSLWPTGVVCLATITLTYSRGRIAQLSTSLSYKIMCDAVVCGTEGELRLPHPFWCPTQLESPGESANSEPVVSEFPLPKPYLPTSFTNGSGLRYEAQEVKLCINAGLKESNSMPWEHSLIVAEIIEEVMTQLGSHR